MTRADILVLICALMLLPWLYWNFWGNASSGEIVQIRVAAGETLKLPLDQDKRLEIAGVLGTSVIEIKDRQVRFVDSPCQGKQCIMTGWLREDGHLAACIPNGVTVQIVGRDERFDTLNF